MPFHISPHLDPNRCAVVNMECQENLLGPNSVLPGLARAAEQVRLIDNLSALFDAARTVGVRVYYCTDERRRDGFGFARNTLMHLRMPPGNDGSGGQGPVIAKIFPREQDVVFSTGAGGDGVLRHRTRCVSPEHRGSPPSSSLEFR
jgi:hypothetical protein